jgi:hypothetical protein
MRKIILTAVMSLALLYIGLVDFSYAEDLTKGNAELTGTEMTEENVPMILAQADEKAEEVVVVEEDEVEVKEEADADEVVVEVEEDEVEVEEKD